MKPGTVKLGGTSTNNIDVWDFADTRLEDADLKGLQRPPATFTATDTLRSTPI